MYEQEEQAREPAETAASPPERDVRLAQRARRLGGRPQQPFVDARRVELVLARQRADLVARANRVQADRAVGGGRRLDARRQLLLEQARFSLPVRPARDFDAALDDKQVNERHKDGEDDDEPRDDLD